MFDYKMIGSVLVTMLFLISCGGGSAEPHSRTAEMVIYVASDDVSTTGQNEVYAVLDDSTGGVMLSHATVQDNTDVQQFKISPDGQWAAWTADSAGFGGYELYVNSTSGGTPVRVSQEARPNRNVTSFDWSPDSRQLVFAGNFDVAEFSGVSANEVWRVNRDGRNLVKINGGIGRPVTVEVRNPQWSPDGRYILQEVHEFNPETNFGASSAFALNLYETSIGAPNSTRLTTMISTLRNPRWSADSQRVSFMGDASIRLDYRIYAINTDGTSLTQVSENGGFNSDSRWSPDSSELAYLDHPSNSFPSDIMVSGASAGAPDRVLALLSTENRGVREYEWAPDGQSIAFIGNVNAESLYELFVVPADGSSAPIRVSPDLLLTGAGVRDFAWSPDSRSIAYLADSITDTLVDLFVISANGSRNVHLSVGLSGEEVGDFAWSNDGERILFSTGPNSRNVAVDSIYAIAPNGSGRILISDSILAGPMFFRN